MADTKMKTHKYQRYLHSKVRKPREESSRTYLKAVEYAKYTDQREESKETGDHPMSILKSIFSSEIFHNRISEESYSFKRDPDEAIRDIDTKNLFDYDTAIHKLQSYKVSTSEERAEKFEKQEPKTVTIDSDAPFDCSDTSHFHINIEYGDKDNAKDVKRHRHILVNKDGSSPMKFKIIMKSESDACPCEIGTVKNNVQTQYETNLNSLSNDSTVSKNVDTKIQTDDHSKREEYKRKVCTKDTCTSDSKVPCCCKSKKNHEGKIYKTNRKTSPCAPSIGPTRKSRSPMTAHTSDEEHVEEENKDKKTSKEQQTLLTCVDSFLCNLIGGKKKVDPVEKKSSSSLSSYCAKILEKATEKTQKKSLNPPKMTSTSTEMDSGHIWKCFSRWMKKESPRCEQKENTDSVDVIYRNPKNKKVGIVPLCKGDKEKDKDLALIVRISKTDLSEALSHLCDVKNSKLTDAEVDGLKQYIKRRKSFENWLKLKDVDEAENKGDAAEKRKEKGHESNYCARHGRKCRSCKRYQQRYQSLNYSFGEEEQRDKKSRRKREKSKSKGIGVGADIPCRCDCHDNKTAGGQNLFKRTTNVFKSFVYRYNLGGGGDCKCCSNK